MSMSVADIERQLWFGHSRTEYNVIQVEKKIMYQAGSLYQMYIDHSTYLEPGDTLVDRDYSGREYMILHTFEEESFFETYTAIVIKDITGPGRSPDEPVTLPSGKFSKKTMSTSFFIMDLNDGNK